MNFNYGMIQRSKSDQNMPLEFDVEVDILKMKGYEVKRIIKFMIAAQNNPQKAEEYLTNNVCSVCFVSVKTLAVSFRFF